MSSTQFPGDVLRGAREELGLTHADVHEQLHISINYVRAIEAGDLDQLPSTTFTAGFIRSYCGLLGLEHRRFVNAYQEYKPDSESTPQDAFTRVFGDTGRWNEIRAWAGVCAVLVVLWVAYMVVVAPATPGEGGAAEAGTQELVLPEYPAFGDSTPTRE